MSTVILDTITGKSTATNITIGSTPVVSASANSMTIRGEGTAHTSIQQGLTKAWVDIDSPTTGNNESITLVDSFNIDSMTDNGTGQIMMVITNDMATVNYVVHISSGQSSTYGAVDSGTQTASQVRVETRNSSDSTVNVVTYVSLLGDLA